MLCVCQELNIGPRLNWKCKRFISGAHVYNMPEENCHPTLNLPSALQSILFLSRFCFDHGFTVPVQSSTLFSGSSRQLF